MTAGFSTLGSVFGITLGALAPLLPAGAESRGELLYATHCIACHTSQVHWRDKRVATDWSSLKAQVRQWQKSASLAWPDRDILNVTRYLNESIYRFEEAVDPLTSLRLER